MSDIQDLQNQLNAKVEAQVKQAQEKAQERALTTRLKLIESEAYQEAMIQQAEQEYKVTTLNTKLEECEALTVSMPIMNNRTRTNRKWNQRYVFEFGQDIQLLYRLATGIRYSVREHKDIMLDITGMKALTIDQFVEAMGSPAYYHQDLGIVVDSQPYNVDQAVSSAMLLGEQLGLAIDTSYLTEDNFHNKFVNAKNQAETTKMEADKATVTNFTMDD